MKNKILTFLGFSVFCVAIYLVYFYKKYDYSKERMEDYVCLMKEANEIFYERLEDEQRERTRKELSYSDYYGKGGKVHHWAQINNLTKKFMDKNQQDFSFNTLEICIKKLDNILVNYNIKNLLADDNFSLPQVPTKEFEKYSVWEKKLCYELIKMKIYECEENSGRWLRVANCGGRTLDSYTYEKF